MKGVIFLICLIGMLLMLTVILICGLVLLFSTKSKKELSPVKTIIATAASICGLCMAILVILFIGGTFIF